VAISLKNLLSSDKINKKIGGLLPPFFLKKSNGGISDTSTNYSKTDLTTLGSLATQKEVVRALIKNSPDASLSTSSMARVAITDGYKVVAYNMDGTINREATVAATTLTNRLDKLRPTYKGFTLPSDFRSLSERAILQLNICGSFGMELVLGKGGVPTNMSVFSTRTLKYEERDEKVIPKITVSGSEYELDSPLVYIADLDQDVETPYSSSPLTAAVQPILADLEFVNDLRRAFNKASLPRPRAKILLDKILESIPPDVRLDDTKLSTYLAKVHEDIKNELNGLQPQDALVHYDIVEVDHLSAGNVSSHNSVKEHKDLINGKVSSGLRTLPAMLGRGASSSAASTESMLHLLSVAGIQAKLNTAYSTLLTTGIRILGYDCYVTFKYVEPNLRPKLELASFEATHAASIMEQNSIGLISDEEMSIELTGGLPSGNFKPLSGTGWYNKSAVADENPYSNTSVTGEGVTETQSQKNNNADKTKPSGEQK